MVKETLADYAVRPQEEFAQAPMPAQAAGFIRETGDGMIAESDLPFIGKLKAMYMNGSRVFIIDGGLGTKFKCIFPDDLSERAESLIGKGVSIIGDAVYVEGDYLPQAVRVTQIDQWGDPTKNISAEELLSCDDALGNHSENIAAVNLDSYVLEFRECKSPAEFKLAVREKYAKKFEENLEDGIDPNLEFFGLLKQVTLLGFQEFVLHDAIGINFNCNFSKEMLPKAQALAGKYVTVISNGIYTDRSYFPKLLEVTKITEYIKPVSKWNLGNIQGTSKWSPGDKTSVEIVREIRDRDDKWR